MSAALNVAPEYGILWLSVGRRLSEAKPPKKDLIPAEQSPFRFLKSCLCYMTIFLPRINWLDVRGISKVVEFEMIPPD
jgi:hypothetical protein